MEKSWEDRVSGWGSDRNLIKGSTPKAQMGKLIEEIGEYATAWAAGNTNDVRDALGDISVVMRIQTAQLELEWASIVPVRWCFCENPVSYLLRAAAALSDALRDGVFYNAAFAMLLDAVEYAAGLAGLSVSECREAAWEEIKDRKGRMVDGVFVKEQ